MIRLRQYQENAVRELLTKSLGLLDKKVSRPMSLVFKAPTGSGKTVMMQEFLKRLSDVPGRKYSYVWLSIGDIAGQSKRSFEKTLEGSKLRFSELSDIRGNELGENEILFVNWEKLNKKSKDKETGKEEWKVRAMRDNERDDNLPTYLENSRKAGRETVLIIDESHRNLKSDRAQEILAEFIRPKIQIEVSATPDSPEPDEIVKVEPEEVIEAGMIRREALMNENIGLFLNETDGSDTVLIRAALEKRDALAVAFEAEGSGVKPLVLVQLPSDSEKASELDLTKLDHVERILAESFGITRENGKLAVWLSADKTPDLDNIAEWDSPAEVLVFKQAIAIGWDCPRAQILVMFREIKSFSFSIQTIGRILRTPEQKHYGNPLLDSAYVYTDLPKVHLKIDGDVKQYLKTKNAVRHPDFPGFAFPLPVERSVRTDYGDVGYSFYAALSKALLDKAGGVSGERENNLFKLASAVDVSVARVSESLLSDGKIALDVDERSERTIESAFSVEALSEDERTQLAFDDFVRRSVRPQFGNVARSYPVMKEALYSALEKEFFPKGTARSKLQAVILTGREFFSGVFEKAKDSYVPLRSSEISSRTDIKRGFWTVPPALEFPELSETGNFKRYAFEPCWISYDSAGERSFVESYLENPSIPVKRWLRNGDGSERYFSVVYEHAGKTGNFYPDFLVEYEDGTLGFFDPKEGFTLETEDARAKLGALKTYVAKLNVAGHKAIFGYVTNFGTKDDPKFYTAEDIEYVSDGTKGFKPFA